MQQLLGQVERHNMTRGFVRIHCAYCDAVLGWQDVDSELMGFNRVSLCERCYIQKRPVDVCFHCGIVHKHKISMIDNEYSAVEDEDETVLPDNIFGNV